MYVARIRRSRAIAISPALYVLVCLVWLKMLMSTTPECWQFPTKSKLAAITR